MSWYEHLDRKIPYIKEYRHFNLWYNYNNGQHHDMKRLRTIWMEYWIRRFCKHEAYSRPFLYAVVTPAFAYIYSTYKRFQPLKTEEASIYSGSQYVASLGRNHYGFETRAAKSFEHAMSVALGSDILTHILALDGEHMRAEEVGDEDQGLMGDFSEEDIISLRKEENHLPHVGIVYFRPELHYLNAKPSDYLSPYKIVGEKV